MQIQLAEPFLSSIRSVIDEQLDLYCTPRSIQVANGTPDTSAMPGNRNPSHWLRIPDVACAFDDIKGSTQSSASLHDRSTAGAYQLSRGTAVGVFHAFDAPYIDVRADRGFALFNGNQVYRAFATAVTFKPFAPRLLRPRDYR